MSQLKVIGCFFPGDVSIEDHEVMIILFGLAVNTERVTKEICRAYGTLIRFVISSTNISPLTGLSGLLFQVDFLCSPEWA